MKKFYFLFFLLISAILLNAQTLVKEFYIQDELEESPSFGQRVTNVGDIDNDGFDDIVISDYQWDNNTGRCFIYLGSQITDNQPFLDDPDYTITGEDYDNFFGYSVAAAGDLNNDGYDDIIIGAYGKNNEGCAYIINGRYPMTVPTTVNRETEHDGIYFGHAVSGAGDINNDGFDDLIIGDYGYGSNTGRCYVYLGKSSIGTINTPYVILEGEGSGDYFGFAISGAGNVDEYDRVSQIGSDYYDDIIIGAYGYNNETGACYIFRGDEFMDDIYDEFITGENTGDRFGISVSDAGYMNNDNFGDIIVGASGYNANTGRCYILYGNDFTIESSTKLTGEATENYFGNSVSGVGHIWQEFGQEYVVVGAYGYKNNTGRSYIYFGEDNSSPMDNAADAILTGEAPNNYFGYSVSGAGDIDNDDYIEVLTGAHGYKHEEINGFPVIDFYGKAYIYKAGGSIRIDSISIDENDHIIAHGILPYKNTSESAYEAHGFIWNEYGSGESAPPTFPDDTTDIGEISNPGEFYSELFLKANTTYYVRAYVIIEGQAYYNDEELTFTTPNKVHQEITIEYQTPLDYEYNNYATSFFVTSSSGLAASFESSNTDVATINNDEAIFVGVGIVEITGSQPGNDNYYPSNSIVWSLWIDKSDLDITAENKTKIYGDENPEFTFSYSGLRYDETSSDLNIVPQANCSATPSTSVGTATITASGEDADHYYCTYHNGTLTINKAELTVTADDKSKTYGDINPAFTLNYDGFKNSENESVLTTEPSASCVATATTGTGDVAITVSGGTDDNYSFNYVDGTLTINQAELTVTANDNSKTYGEANPDFTFYYTGFVNSEDESVLNTEPTASSSADETTGAGTTPITASGGVADNYSFNYVDGTLNINKTELTVTAEDNTKTYGETNPAFTISYNGFVNGENESVLTIEPTASSSADETTGVGTAPITASGGIADNYSFNYIDGTLTINKVELTVTAEDNTKTYGEANPAFTISYNGFVNDENESVLTSEPTATSTADETTGVGTAPITASGGVADNYNFNYVDGTITINKAELIITADDKEKEQGEINPEFTLSYNGFVNSDNESMLDNLPSISCDADQNSNIGDYDIVLEGGNDNNYTYVLQNGVLTITESTNIEFDENVKFAIYPNPSRGVFNISCDGINFNQVKIFNLVGCVVYEQNYFSNNETINISGNDQGVYFVQLKSDNQIITKRIVLE